MFNYELSGVMVASVMTQHVQNFLLALPGILAALIVLILGYFIGALLGLVTAVLIKRSGVDKWLVKSKLAKSIGYLKMAHAGELIVKWYVFTVFLGVTADWLNLGIISTLLRRFAEWFPNLVIAIVLMLMGLIAADYAGERILHVKRKGTGLISMLVKLGIVVFIALIALEQIGVTVTLATGMAFILAGGIVLALSVALGISFGLALKDEAKGLIKGLKKGL